MPLAIDSLKCLPGRHRIAGAEHTVEFTSRQQRQCPDQQSAAGNQGDKRERQITHGIRSPLQRGFRMVASCAAPRGTGLYRNTPIPDRPATNIFSPKDKATEAKSETET